MSATIEQLREALAPRKQKPSPHYTGVSAWGRGGPKQYTYSARDPWVLPALLFDALVDYTLNVDHIFKRYPTESDAENALAIARNKLYEQLGRLSDKCPFYGTASGTYIWDNSEHPDLFTRSPISQVPYDWFNALRGNKYGAHCRNYSNESEAYIDLGRVMAEECASAPAPQPVSEEKTVETNKTVETSAKTYTPFPSPSGTGAYWHHENSTYGDASLPKALFAALTGATSKSPDWAYYDSPAYAATALKAAQDKAAVDGLEPVELVGRGPRTPFGGYTEPYITPHGTYAWTNDVNHKHWLPKELHAALTGGKRGPFDGRREDLVVYRTALEAALDLRKALADLKWVKDAAGKWVAPPPAPKSVDRTTGREPASGGSGLYWYWACPNYQFVNAGSINGIEAARIPRDVIDRMPDVDKSYADSRGGVFVQFRSRDAAMKAYNDIVNPQPAAVEPKTFADTARTYAPHKGQGATLVWVTATAAGTWYDLKETSKLPDEVWAALPSGSSGIMTPGTDGLRAPERWKGYATAVDAMAALYKALVVAGPRVPARLLSGTEYLWLTPASKDGGVGSDPITSALCRVPDDAVERMKEDRTTNALYLRGDQWVMFKSAEAATKAYDAAAAAIAAEKTESAKKLAPSTGDDRAPARHPDGRWYWVTPDYRWSAPPLTNDKECRVPQEIITLMTGSTGDTTSVCGYATEEAAVTAYKAAKAAYQEKEEKKTKDAAAKPAPKFVEGKAPYPASQGANYWYWTLPSYRLSYGGVTLGGDTCAVAVEFMAALLNESCQSYASITPTSCHWISYRTKDDACAAYVAAEEKLQEAAAKVVEKKPEPKYVAYALSSGNMFWLAGQMRGNYVTHPASQLPLELFDALAGGSRSDSCSVMYTTAEAAAKALEEAEKKVAAGSKPEAKIEVKAEEPKPAGKAYKPHLLSAMWYWISENKPGMWSGDTMNARLPRELFNRLTRASKCCTESTNCWAGYDSEKEALAGLADAQTLVALDNAAASVKADAIQPKTEAKVEEPAYAPHNYTHSYTKASWFWIEQGYVANGWGADHQRAILPPALFACLPAGSAAETTGYSNHNKGYATKDAAAAALAAAEKALAEKKIAAEKEIAAVLEAKLAYKAPAVGTKWNRVEALRSSALKDAYEVIRCDDKAGEVVVKLTQTQTLVVSADVFRDNFRTAAEWKIESDCDENGNPI